MDQESFERGLAVGLATACVIVEREPFRSLKALRRYENRMRETIDERWNGNRRMVAADILLSMPIMTAADLGLCP